MHQGKTPAKKCRFEIKLRIVLPSNLKGLGLESIKNAFEEILKTLIKKLKFVTKFKKKNFFCKNCNFVFFHFVYLISLYFHFLTLIYSVNTDSLFLELTLILRGGGTLRLPGHDWHQVMEVMVASFCSKNTTCVFPPLMYSSENNLPMFDPSP